MIITIFGGFAVVHLTCRTLKLYNKSWFFKFYFYRGRQKIIGKFVVGNILKELRGWRCCEAYQLLVFIVPKV